MELLASGRIAAPALSAFNSRPGIGPALERTIAALGRCPTLVVSFNDEGYLPRAALERMLGARGASACHGNTLWPLCRRQDRHP